MRISLLSIFIVLLLNCSSSLPNNENFTNVKTECFLKNKNEIYISITNNNLHPIEMKKPCIFNTHINIQKNGHPLTTKIKVKANPECMFPTYSLGKEESANFKYNYNIDNLYDLQNNTEYEMSIEYYVFENNKLKEKSISPNYKFLWSDN